MTQDQTPEYPVSREILYEFAWSQPMTSIAKIFGVSSSYLARIYSRLNIPRPAPGYWAKIAAGKTVNRPKMSEAAPGQLLEWDRYKDAAFYRTPEPRPPKRELLRTSALKQRRGVTHPLIRGAKEHFLKTRDSSIGYSSPFKRNLVDLIVSTDQIDTVLRLANNLFLSLEGNGLRVCLSQPNDFKFNRPPIDEREKPDNQNRFVQHWSPGRETIVYVGTVAIGLTIFEFSESLESYHVGGKRVPVPKASKGHKQYQQRWTTTHDFPAGRFCLRAYSPYQGTSWACQWNIKANQDMSKFGEKIAQELTDHASTIASLVIKAKEDADLARKAWEEERRIWEIKERKRQQEEAKVKSLQELQEIISHWQVKKQIYDFFQEVENTIDSYSDDVQPLIRLKLTKAREIINTPDALLALSEWKTPEERIR